ncbi:cytochrome b [Litoribrevibacter euphylliae]|uniref:Cytochrome b n=1 Tax=Litoribrevibacter euphylliae TaxID=1834034 RepID=A0ABV7HK20_9GAMM
MQIKNTESRFGAVAISVHWVAALTIIGLFASGIYMRSLSYYDSLYQTLPPIHKGIGILLFILIVFRLVWRVMNVQPKPLENHSKAEKVGAKLAHFGLYLLMLVVMVSGYLISTAKGHGVDVFGLFEIPALVAGGESQGDLAGMIHEYVAYTLIGLAVLHALGALKHHFLDKDRTLMRMIKGS